MEIHHIKIVTDEPHPSSVNKVSVDMIASQFVMHDGPGDDESFEVFWGLSCSINHKRVSLLLKGMCVLRYRGAFE